MLQVYAASIMFGYFVRRVDNRFQLEKGLGLLDEGSSDAVSRLERLFAQVSAPPEMALLRRDDTHMLPCASSFASATRTQQASQ